MFCVPISSELSFRNPPCSSVPLRHLRYAVKNVLAFPQDPLIFHDAKSDHDGDGGDALTRPK